MASGRLLIPSWMPALDSDGNPIAGVKAYFYVNLTTTLAPIYSNEALTTPLTNPVEANSSGRFPAIWADGDVLYSVAIEAPYGPAGVPFSYDNLSVSLGADIATAEAAEAAADDANAALASTLAAIEAATEAGGGSAALAGALAGQAAANVVVATRVPYTELASSTGLDLVGNGTNIVLASTSPKLDIPTGNPFAPTMTYMSVRENGDDPVISGLDYRVFAFMSGVDNKGQQGVDNETDLVAGYFGAIGSAYTTGDDATVRKAVWAINALTEMKAGSGTYNARTAEFDFNNGLRHIGDGDGSAFASEVLAAGLEVFNSGFRSSAGVLINVGSDGSNPYNRGFAVAPGAAYQAGFADYSNAAYSYDSRGAHAYGLHFVGTYSSGNVLNGALTVGSTADPGVGITLDIYGAANLRSTLAVGGETRINASMNVGGSGAPEAGINLDVQGNSKLRGFLNVLGATNLSGSFGVTLDGGLKAVSVGANDSGGAGFKVLRIAN